MTLVNPVATRCAVCRAPLNDAKSAEQGIGPVCIKKYGFGADHPCTHAERERANHLVFQVAVMQSALNKPELTDEIKAACAELNLLGFGVLAERIAERSTSKRKPAKATIFVTLTPGGGYTVRTPWIGNRARGLRVARAWRSLGINYDKATKSRHVPVAKRRALWDLLGEHFAGATGEGPQGQFEVTR